MSTLTHTYSESQSNVKFRNSILQAVINIKGAQCLGLTVTWRQVDATALLFPLRQSHAL